MNERTKNGFKTFVTLLERFFGSDLFIALNALLVAIAWLVGIWAPIICVMVALGALSLFVCRDAKSFFPALFMFSLTISVNHKTLDNYAPMLVLVAVLFAGIAFNFIFFKRKLTLLRPSKIKGFNCSLLALVIPFALGGVGSTYEHPLAVVAALALMILFGVGYSFFFVSLSNSPNKGDLPKYVLKILFATGLVIVLQLVVYFARMGNFDDIVRAMTEKDIKLGWAGPNNVAPMLSMCIPATLFFCLKKNRLTPLFALVALLEYALLFTTGCRGAMLFTTIAMPAMILYVGIKSENRVSFCVTICLLFAVAVVLLGYFGKDVANILTAILNKGLDSSGRDRFLYPEAWAVFKAHPIFGAGWDYRLGELANNNYTPYWFHSTALQILATMGVVGVIAFGFFYFWRYRTFLARVKEPAVVALLAGLGLFDAYGMVDTNFFGPTFFLMLLIMTISVEVGLPENKCRAFGGKAFAFIAARLRALTNNSRPEKPSPASDNDNNAQCAEPETKDIQNNEDEQNMQTAELPAQNETNSDKDQTCKNAESEMTSQNADAKTSDVGAESDATSRHTDEQAEKTQTEPAQTEKTQTKDAQK